jgi:hypothetical protein
MTNIIFNSYVSHNQRVVFMVSWVYLGIPIKNGGSFHGKLFNNQMVPSIVSSPRHQDLETAMVRLCGFAQRHPDLAFGREPGVVASGHGSWPLENGFVGSEDSGNIWKSMENDVNIWKILEI